MTFRETWLANVLGIALILFVGKAITSIEQAQTPPEELAYIIAPSSSAISKVEPAAGQPDTTPPATVAAPADASFPPPPPASFNEATLGLPEEDAPVRISPSKSEILHLERDAASVIVSNPAHAAVLLDSPRVLIVLPRAPGATSFTVLDSAGETILEKKVLVSSGSEPYVRVRKVCGSGAGDCSANSYYYCPDGCYEVSTDAISSSSINSIPAVPGGRSSTASAAAPSEEQVEEEQGGASEQPAPSPPANAVPSGTDENAESPDEEGGDE